MVAGTTFESDNAVRVRLNKKLAEQIDGVDLSTNIVGDVLDLSQRDAELLIAEQWATFDERRRQVLGPVYIERRKSVDGREQDSMRRDVK